MLCKFSLCALLLLSCSKLERIICLADYKDSLSSLGYLEESKELASIKCSIDSMVSS